MSEASYPGDVKYHPQHDWARIDGDTATFGLTWHAQDQLGEIVFVDPPEVGATVTKDQPFGELESVKSVSDLIAPLSGEVIAVNDAVVENPDIINAEPYDGGWIIQVKLSDPGEVDSLLDADAYSKLVAP